MHNPVRVGDKYKTKGSPIYTVTHFTMSRNNTMLNIQSKAEDFKDPHFSVSSSCELPWFLESVAKGETIWIQKHIAPFDQIEKLQARIAQLESEKRPYKWF